MTNTTIDETTRTPTTKKRSAKKPAKKPTKKVARKATKKASKKPARKTAVKAKADSLEQVAVQAAVDKFLREQMPTAPLLKGALWAYATKQTGLTSMGESWAKMALALSTEKCFFCDNSKAPDAICGCVLEGHAPAAAEESPAPAVQETAAPAEEVSAPATAETTGYLWERNQSMYLAMLQRGEIALTDRAYSYDCADCRRKVDVPHTIVQVGLVRFGKHRRRNRCPVCFSRKKEKELAQRPSGQSGKPTKPKIKPFPPLRHLPFEKLAATTENQS